MDTRFLQEEKEVNSRRAISMILGFVIEARHDPRHLNFQYQKALPRPTTALSPVQYFQHQFCRQYGVGGWHEIRRSRIEMELEI